MRSRSNGGKKKASHRHSTAFFLHPLFSGLYLPRALEVNGEFPLPTLFIKVSVFRGISIQREDFIPLLQINKVGWSADLNVFNYCPRWALLERLRPQPESKGSMTPPVEASVECSHHRSCCSILRFRIRDISLRRRVHYKVFVSDLGEGFFQSRIFVHEATPPKRWSV